MEGGYSERLPEPLLLLGVVHGRGSIYGSSGNCGATLQNRNRAGVDEDSCSTEHSLGSHNSQRVRIAAKTVIEIGRAAC